MDQCIAVGNLLTEMYIYVVPVYHLNTGIRGPININISLNRKKYVIITIIRLIINCLIFTIIRLITVHENLL